MRVSKNCPGNYRKKVKSISVPKMVDSGPVSRKNRIRASTEKLFGRLPENGRISVNAGKW